MSKNPELTQVTRTLTRALAEQGIKLGHQNAQHIIAALLGDANYHVLAAQLKKVSGKPEDATSNALELSDLERETLLRAIDFYREEEMITDVAVLDEICVKLLAGVTSTRTAIVPQLAACNATDFPVFLLGEELTTCPHCGSRTAFDDMPDGRQHHWCLNSACGFEFIGEEDEDAKDESEDNDIEAIPAIVSFSDKYAEKVLGTDPFRFDALELHGMVAELDDEKPTSFSVFVHDAEEGGIVCVGDFGSYLDAHHYAQELRSKYSWTLFDYARGEK